MPEITRDEVEEALAGVLAAREATIVALRLTDPDDPSRPYDVGSLPGPARPEDIARVELALGVTLPPSYQHFLRLHDGLQDVDLGSDLLGTKRLVEFNLGPAQRVLSAVLDEIKRDTAEGLVVFGTTKGDSSMFIFDAHKADAFGEWTVIEYDAEDGLLDEYDNFLDFLKDTADTIRLMSGGRG